MLDTLRNFIRARSEKLEFQVVMILAFGLFLVGSISSLFLHPTGPRFERGRFIGLVSYEICVLAITGWVLKTRGWTLARLGIAPTIGQTLLGPVFFIGTYLLWIPVLIMFQVFLPRAVHEYGEVTSARQSLGFDVILAVSLVNGFFEEVFLCGYLVTVVRKTQGAAVAIAASTFIRVFYHSYQGPVGMVAIALDGVIFAGWFLKTRKLWPLIVAHMLLDFVGLSMASLQK